ncbi:MAG: restriction endonuclease [Oscillospiraceae bacterium]|nr:restriction endonuclease [Oscillospiraceae bacterium]
MAKKRRRKGRTNPVGFAILLVVLLVAVFYSDVSAFIDSHIELSLFFLAVLILVAVILMVTRRKSPMGTIDQVDNMDGHDFEYWCATLLRKTGYSNVVVTRGSGDQGVDITAYKDGIKYAFQCKRYSSKLSNKPVQEVYAGKAMYGCQVGVVMTNNYFTEGAQQLAKRTHVLLWDRNTLRRMLASIRPEKQPKKKAKAAPVLPAAQELPVNEPQAKTIASTPQIDEKVLTTYQGELIEKAIDVVVEAGYARTSQLQRHLGLGYARSARTMDELENLGIIEYGDNINPRKVIMTRQQWLDRKKYLENCNTKPSESIEAYNSDSGYSGDISLEEHDSYPDDIVERAIEAVVEAGQASTSFLQRRLKLGYARAARTMDELESMGIVGPADGAKPRQVLMTKAQWLERRAMIGGTPQGQTDDSEGD